MLRGKRWHLEGLAKVPGAGPVVFRIETIDPVAIRGITSAVDRYLVIVKPTDDQLLYAKKVLARGDLVGVVMNQPMAAHFVKQLAAPEMTVTVETDRIVFHDKNEV